MISQQLGEFVSELREMRIQRSIDSKSPLERALAQLQENKRNLNADDLDIAVEILSKKENALTYISLQGDLRNDWFDRMMDRAMNSGDHI